MSLKGILGFKKHAVPLLNMENWESYVKRTNARRISHDTTNLMYNVYLKKGSDDIGSADPNPLLDTHYNLEIYIVIFNAKANKTKMQHTYCLYILWGRCNREAAKKKF